MAKNQNEDPEIVGNAKPRLISINSEEGQKILSRELGVEKERCDQAMNDLLKCDEIECKTNW